MYKGKKIIYLFDPPHLIKAIRNNLLKYHFHFGGKVAKWNDIVTIFEKDRTLSIRCCPKLTKKHINLNGFTKMKVKYATQVLSHSVSATILLHVSLGALPSTATGSAEFIAVMDKLFDSLNSSSLNGPKLHRRAVTKNSIHHQFFKEMIEFIQSIKVVSPATQEDVTNYLKCLDGFCITINGVQSLWAMLSQENFQFLLTRRLNQDPLENFFGSIRQQGGNADNPTPLQFTRAFKKLFYDNFLINISTGNCTADFDSILAGSTYQPKSKKASSSKTILEAPEQGTIEVDVTDFKTCLEDNAIGMNAIAYVAVYLLKKCLLKHPCEICKEELINNQFDDSSQLFCMFKAYNETKEKPFGRLLSPNKQFLDYITGMEAIFVAYRELTSTKKKNRKFLKVSHL